MMYITCDATLQFCSSVFLI